MRGSRDYSGMRQLQTFEERFEYLSLEGIPGEATFGHARWMNQNFYTSREWKDVRQEVIARDDGCDLGMPGFEIHDRIIIHHIIPMRMEDFEYGNPLMLDPNNLITTTHATHNAIHYGDREQLVIAPIERRPGDTRLW